MPYSGSLSSSGWNFDNSYIRLPEILYARQLPIPVTAPETILYNLSLGTSLGLSADLANPDRARCFSGNLLPSGADPIAQAYAGHQFGHFTMLGDGRALLLGEQVTPTGERFDIQLKGAGRTPFSRRGDGRAALSPMLREYIVSEAMHALGIPTTRSLAVISTGENVWRETALPGAILTRVAASHIRVGTFQYLAAADEHEALRLLADHAIARHYPEAAEDSTPYLTFFRAVLLRQAALVTKWLLVGFVHGVMNTDNVSICGETIDYGPCAFLDTYDPDAVFSSIDHNGRYAYGNQPSVMQWNLTRFAEALLPLFDDREEQAREMASDALAAFPDAFRHAWTSGMAAKLGLESVEDGDLELSQDLLALMREHRADYTATLRGLSEETTPETPHGTPFFREPGFLAWRDRWEARLARQSGPIANARKRMRALNPAVIPRNRRVEEALEAAAARNLAPLERLLSALSQPYENLPEYADLAEPPTPWPTPYKTFCGT